MVKRLFVLTVAVVLAASYSSQAFWKFGKKAEKAEATVEAAAGDFTPVTSSLLKAVRYDEAAEVLTIQFVKGDTYEYANVPKKVYNGLMKAESKGKYFTSKIKGHFEATKK